MFVAPFAAPFPSPVASSGAAAVPWYLAGGVAAANCKAAYQAIGAASLSASYTNLANPGTNDAAPGLAPTWASATGWTFNGTSQYLTTGVTPVNDQTWSLMVRYTMPGTSTGFLLGAFSGSAYYALQPNYPDNNLYYENGSYLGVSPRLASGVVGFAGNKGYRNGSADSGTIPTATGTLPAVFIGCLNSGGSPAYYHAASIQAVAIYNTALTSAQVSAISTAAAALTG